MRKFSGRNVYCNSCGALMRVDEDEEMIFCDECGNEGWLDSEDPEAPGQPMQLSSPSGYHDIYSDRGAGSNPDEVLFMDPEDF